MPQPATDILQVFADFDFLPAQHFVGELHHERVRGNSVYKFCFSPEWLEKHSNITLCANLLNTTGWQYSTGELFGCFGDALPDRWGRTLIDIREQLNAREEGRAPRSLSSYDYLCQLDDATRMGGLRFKKDDDNNFLNDSETLSVPPITSIRELIDASLHIEQHIEKGIKIEDKWIRQLYAPGTSLGGARPKANVIGEDGSLLIAKFPSRNDRINIGLWEHFCHIMAKKAGINAADTSVLSIDKHHTFLSRRFDRAGGKRIHFASSMALLGFHDGDGAQTGKGYLDIVDFIIGHCANVQANLEELFRRAAFNICMGNADDHFRNHGFLLTDQGGIFSPAYDLNPTLSDHQALLISNSSNDADLRLLVDGHDDYFLNYDTAHSIVQEVQHAVEQWRKLAKQLHIKEEEVRLFQSRLDKWSDVTL